MTRNILASEPRVTRFKINWEEPNAQESTNNADNTEQSNAVGASTSTQAQHESNASMEVPAFNENSNSWATMECS